MRMSFSDRVIFRALLFGSLLAAYEPTVGLDTDDLLFYAPFDSNIDVSYSNGDPRASVATQEAYAFKVGIRGQAIVFGGRVDESKSHEVLSYKTDGNVLPTHDVGDFNETVRNRTSFYRLETPIDLAS